MSGFIRFMEFVVAAGLVSLLGYCGYKITQSIKAYGEASAIAKQKESISIETKIETLKAELADAEKEAAKIKTLADANAYEKQRTIQADGALTQKLDKLYDINKVWAEAFSNYKGNIVPSTVMGGSAGSSGNAFQQFMDIQNAKAIKDLNIDMHVKQ